jgi:hypothetical protein
LILAKTLSFTTRTGFINGALGFWKPYTGRTTGFFVLGGNFVTDAIRNLLIKLTGADPSLWLGAGRAASRIPFRFHAIGALSNRFAVVNVEGA